MAVAFTVNTTPSMGEWDIVDGYSTDVSTAQALLASSSAHNYLVKSITVTILSTDRWFKILNGTTLAVGPVEPRGNYPWHIRYESPMVFTGAVNVQTQSDKEIHISMCYRKFATP